MTFHENSRTQSRNSSGVPRKNSQSIVDNLRKSGIVEGDPILERSQQLIESNEVLVVKHQGFCSTLAQIFCCFKLESQEKLLERYFSKQRKIVSLYGDDHERARSENAPTGSIIHIPGLPKGMSNDLDFGDHISISDGDAK